MEHQLTIRLPDDLSHFLCEASRDSGLKRADIVRAALRAYLQIPLDTSHQRPIDRVRDLLGRFSADVNDDPGAEPRQALIRRIRRHAHRPA